MMWLQVNPKSPIPIYQQIVNEVKIRIAKGLLEPGEKIPSIRESAVELTLNPNTVAKAYRELEHDGMIVVLRGRGTYVAESRTVPDREKRMQELKQLMKRVLIESNYLGISEDELVKMLQDAIVEWNKSAL